MQSSPTQQLSYQGIGIMQSSPTQQLDYQGMGLIQPPNFPMRPFIPPHIVPHIDQTGPMPTFLPQMPFMPELGHMPNNYSFQPQPSILSQLERPSPVPLFGPSQGHIHQSLLSSPIINPPNQQAPSAMLNSHILNPPNPQVPPVIPAIEMQSPINQTMLGTLYHI